MLVSAVGETLIVLADVAPGPTDSLCLRLTWPLTSPWIAVEVRSSRTTRIGPTQLKLVPRREVDAAVLATLRGKCTLAN